jgi:hypothetical protein
MNKPSICCVPKLYYWFLGGIVCPVGAFVATAVIVRPLFFVFESDLVGYPLLFFWLTLTAPLTAWTYIRDYRRLSYTLATDAIIIGRGASALSIPFSEIESIVVSLPKRMPWWLRIQWFNPELQRNVMRSREFTIVVRLSGGRYLPLNLDHPSLINGRSFIANLLRRNRTKILGHDSYTDTEIKVLTSARLNMLKTL